MMFTISLNQAFGINESIVLIILGITVCITIIGGLKRISGIVEKVVPFMSLLYIIAGFAGATVRDAIRFWVARGLYSNDAGTGYGIVAHAAAKTDHPVRQSPWELQQHYSHGLLL